MSAILPRVTGQLADATGDFACLVFVLLAASASPRVDQSAINHTKLVLPKLLLTGILVNSLHD